MPMLSRNRHKLKVIYIGVKIHEFGAKILLHEIIILYVAGISVKSKIMADTNLHTMT